MAENQDGQEKSQEPTGKRIDDARKKGQVPRSRELNTMVITIMGVVTLFAMAPRFTTNLHTLFEEQFVLSRAEIFDPNALLGHLVNAIGDALLMLMPFFAVMIVVAILSSVALGGFNVSFEAMQPKFSKLNPIKGIKKMFSMHGLMELLKSLGKFLLVGSATVAVLYNWSEELLHLADLDAKAAIQEGLNIVAWSALILASTLIVMALIDVPFQLWQHNHELKMTQQEVRDELKQTEGRPEVKSRIRRVQFEMAQRRMMQEIPNADVIVTNPTHYAVALRYNPEKTGAPVVVAKGKDLVAANIRELGAANKVPLVEAPALARAIYFNTELQQQIPAALFLAVAQLLAYVFQLRAYQVEGGDIPTPPQEYPVPEEYRHD
ncbi:MAG: flagellar biosynthesis protein FlhB [Chromatiaceae bacterium]|jgi:flagellar biosynthetic protein FlhB|nr:flagellar biosynthesis protein FlhB [Chromatiaceae bacterium]